MGTQISDSHHEGVVLVLLGGRPEHVLLRLLLLLLLLLGSWRCLLLTLRVVVEVVGPVAPHGEAGQASVVVHHTDVGLQGANHRHLG